LAEEEIDPDTISTEQMLNELMEDVWADASALIKGRIKTHWKNTSHSSSGGEGTGTPSASASTIAFGPERMTHAALDGMDVKDWAGARDRLVDALAVDGQFVPALLVIRALRLTRPSVFKQGDIMINEAMKRILGTSTEANERSKRFVESLASTQSSSTSGSRKFLVGNWKDRIEMDHTKAMKWYRKAAEQGNADAQNNLGACFKYGQGVAKDPVEAVKWYRIAAEQGHASAQFFLGECFMNGDGVAKDPAEAVK
jgi:hypothetical protein